MKGTKKLKITSRVFRNRLNIYFNDILHIGIVTTNLQFQSWKENDSWFTVELYTINGVITLEYNNSYKWNQVLNILDGINY